MAKKLTINMKDFTAADPHAEYGLYFLKGRYEDGDLLAFYSHSPWGREHDQERGWVLINGMTLAISDRVPSYSWGSTGQARAQLKAWREKHGKLTLFKDGFGDQPWKMADN